MPKTQLTDAWKPLPVEPVPRVALRPAEAAKALGISTRTFAEWQKLPGFPLLRIGGVRMIPTDQLRKWLAKQLADAEATA